MSDTKQRLLDGAMAALREHGIAGVSARTIAAAAGVNQALVFYHYGSVDELLAAASVAAARARVDDYSDRFAAAGSMRELLDIGRVMFTDERKLGNVSVLAQLLAGAQSDPKLVEPVAAALRMWTVEIESVVRRQIAGSPLAEVADVAGLANAVSAAFIGLELLGGVDDAAARGAIAALDQLAILIDVFDDLGPIARRAVRARITRVTKSP
ncbi:TetR/AcrR family transcriptional regulator [Fodinicola feengrottensis]|uniref:TetR family transcriptional regulator n=1 Tax=Fodinicola feengrottensis TaxID=435914 RepID=A0ABP4UW74_9ACTN|nr:TetR/AcrR family transcriptional regulator [Fodinicola feengrottensis]